MQLQWATVWEQEDERKESVLPGEGRRVRHHEAHSPEHNVTFKIKPVGGAVKPTRYWLCIFHCQSGIDADMPMVSVWFDRPYEAKTWAARFLSPTGVTISAANTTMLDR